MLPVRASTYYSYTLYVLHCNYMRWTLKEEKPKLGERRNWRRNKRDALNARKATNWKGEGEGGTREKGTHEKSVLSSCHLEDLLFEKKV